MMRRTILFDISGHGLGHLAISGPVIRRLRERAPTLEIVVRTRLAASVVHQFTGAEIAVVGSNGEVTPVLHDAVHTDLAATAAVLSELDHEFDAAVQRERAAIESLAPDLVVANVSYLALAACQAARLPNMALCCMNWADVFEALGLGPRHAALISRLRDIHAATDRFLQPAPHMDMPDVPSRQAIGPIARCGVRRRIELARVLGLPSDMRLALYSLGGVPGPAGTEPPALAGTHWIVTDPNLANRPDITPAHRSGWRFEDLVASVDAIVGKDSYGTVVEAACAGVPLVMIPRDGWPETPFLVEWARRNTTLEIAEPGALGVAAALDRIITAMRPSRIVPSGIDEAAGIILAAIAG